MELEHRQDREASSNEGTQLPPRQTLDTFSQVPMSNSGSNVCKGRVPFWSPSRAPLLPAPRDPAAPPCFLSPPAFPAMPDLRDTPRTADIGQASGEPRRRHFLQPARGSEHRRAARPYTPMPHGPARPGYTPRTKRRRPGGAGYVSGRGWNPRPGQTPQNPRPGPQHQRLTMWQETPPASTSKLTIWQGPCGPLQRLCLLPPAERQPEGAGEARSPLSHSPCPRLSPPRPWSHYHQGGPARPSAIPRLPLPALADPRPASPGRPAAARLAVRQQLLPRHWLRFSVHQSRPTPLSYEPGATKEPHPSRPRKESK